MVSWSLTSSGIILCFVPPLNDPTVITASSKGLIFLLTIVWSYITIKEAVTIGSIDICGAAPWAPSPKTVISTDSVLAII